MSAKRLNNLPDNFMRKKSFTSMVKERDKKRAAAKRKKAAKKLPKKQTLTFVGYLKIPLSAVESMHMGVPQFKNMNDLEVEVYKIVGQKCCVVFDLAKCN